MPKPSSSPNPHPITVFILVCFLCRSTSLAFKARDAYLKVQKYVPFLHRKPAAQRTLLHSKAPSPEESGDLMNIFNNHSFSSCVVLCRINVCLVGVLRPYFYISSFLFTFITRMLQRLNESHPPFLDYTSLLLSHFSLWCWNIFGGHE